MIKIIGFFICIVALFSCEFSPNKDMVKKAPVMYKPSEMALLMRRMYEVNKVVKGQIIRKDTLLPFPNTFLTIHSAILTEPSDRDIEFDSLAKEFINNQERTFSSSSDSTVIYFNKSISTCVACHENRCTGPIPKIKKLLIH